MGRMSLLPGFLRQLFVNYRLTDVLEPLGLILSGIFEFCLLFWIIISLIITRVLSIRCLILDKSCLKTKDLEWFFFCPREKKYAGGVRVEQATENGYWKTTGRDRLVHYDSRTVGMVKTLFSHMGHAPQGERADWVIHEHRILD